MPAARAVSAISCRRGLRARASISSSRTLTASFSSAAATALMPTTH
jgi:hypothetical protein